MGWELGSEAEGRQKHIGVPLPSLKSKAKRAKSASYSKDFMQPCFCANILGQKKWNEIWNTRGRAKQSVPFRLAWWNVTVRVLMSKGMQSCLARGQTKSPEENRPITQMHDLEWYTVNRDQSTFPKFLHSGIENADSKNRSVTWTIMNTQKSFSVSNFLGKCNDCFWFWIFIGIY
jgi:hypothetical protein